MIVLRLPFILLRLLVQSALLALGQIWANKSRSVLTTTGIIIGVASVTAVIAGLTGLKTKVLSDFQTVGTNRIIIQASRPETGPLHYVPWFRLRFYPEQVEGLLEHCPSLTLVTRSTSIAGPVRRGQKQIDNVNVMGIDPAWHKLENRSVILGRTFSLIDAQHRKRVCLVTPDVRDKLMLDRECVGETLTIGDRTYFIVGVVEPPVKLEVFGGGNNPWSEVFVPFETAYQRGYWLGIDALAKSPEVAEDAKAEIAFFLRQSRKVRPGEQDTFRVETLQRLLEQFNSISMAVTAVAGGIVGVSLLVGGVGIMNIMLVSVSERTREIGLRKAVGARPSAILLQFLVEAVVLCLVGGSLGVCFGQLLTTVMKQIPHSGLDRAAIPAWAVLVSLGFSTTVGLFFGMFPAVKAARMNPIEALRHE